MGWQVITEPAEEPITLAEAKAQINAPNALDDDYLSSAIVAARQWVEHHIERSLVTQTLQLSLDAFPSEIELLRGPAQSITSIVYIDSNGAEQTLASDQYGLDSSGPLYNRRDWVLRAIGAEWPDTYATELAVKVNYVAGFGAASEVPQLIKQAIKLLVSDFYEHREETVIGVSVAKRGALDMLLSPYRTHRA